MNRATGEITQMEFFEDRDFERVRYDWTPNPGRHINVPKKVLQKLYAKGGGFSSKDRDVLFFYYGFSPDEAQPLRLTFKEISGYVGGRPDTVAKCVAKLHQCGLLLEAERVGRMTFYRVNPRAGFDGSAAQQVKAAADARLPEIPLPEAKDEKRVAS